MELKHHGKRCMITFSGEWQIGKNILVKEVRKMKHLQ